ncbi:nuclear transport factor 2 family protein [Chitinophagaceae bacterium LB-8]|uniref:Nuclear transport factor 2 family protein n=1 Tax=Paraflavisolibacter caeni TaxID=2982496 RepID=A0A9X3BIE8_9BACT|nr:nuclear transport factor 2 family protein [Paraflavisolibacter caeni]MCU7551227.1 nuclear transport factor 2 family protein [Paraflavisolibacter caeni]
MSTQVAASNAIITRELFDAFLRGDIPYILNHLDENCQWNVMGAPLLPHAGKYIGSGTGLFFTKLNEDFEFPTFEVQDIYEVNDTDVITTGHIVARSIKTGKTAESPFMMLNRYKNGKVVYFQNYVDSAALAQTLK